MASGRTLHADDLDHITSTVEFERARDQVLRLCLLTNLSGDSSANWVKHILLFRGFRDKKKRLIEMTSMDGSKVESPKFELCGIHLAKRNICYD